MTVGIPRSDRYSTSPLRSGSKSTTCELMAQLLQSFAFSGSRLHSLGFPSARALQVTPVLPQMVALTESYIQVYQRQDRPRQLGLRVLGQALRPMFAVEASV